MLHGISHYNPTKSSRDKSKEIDSQTEAQRKRLCLEVDSLQERLTI